MGKRAELHGITPKPALLATSCVAQPQSLHTPPSASASASMNPSVEDSNSAAATGAGESFEGNQDPVLMKSGDQFLEELLASRTHTLRCARDDFARMHGEFSKQCEAVEEILSRRVKDFEDYSSMPMTADGNQQRRRKALRDELHSVAFELVQAQSFLSTTSVKLKESQDELRTAKQAQLSNIDAAIARLTDFRARTEVRFQECEEQQEVSCARSEDWKRKLEPSLNRCGGDFLRAVNEEINEELNEGDMIAKQRQVLQQAEKQKFQQGQLSRTETSAKTNTTRVQDAFFSQDGDGPARPKHAIFSDDKPRSAEPRSFFGRMFSMS